MPENHPVILNEEQKRAFERLREMVVNYTRLAHPIKNAPLVFETNASSRGMSAILHQLDKGKLSSIAFWSKSFTKEQIHLDIYIKELEAMYQAINRFSIYLIDAQLIIYSDNKTLVHKL